MTQQEEKAEAVTEQADDALEVPSFDMPEVAEPAVDLRFDDNTPIFNETVDDMRDQLTSVAAEQPPEDPADDGDEAENTQESDGDDSGEVDQD